MSIGKEWVLNSVQELQRHLTKNASVLESYDGDTKLWTELVLNWFSNRAPAGVLVDATPPCKRLQSTIRGLPVPLHEIRDTAGEWLVDLSYSTYPRYEDDWEKPAYWERVFAMAEPPEMLLAVESEWGSLAPGPNRCRILEDATKLAAVRARNKLMVFGSKDGGAQRNDILDHLRRLRDLADSGGTWLWMDVPWSWAKNSPAGGEL